MPETQFGFHQGHILTFLNWHSRARFNYSSFFCPLQSPSWLLVLSLYYLCKRPVLYLEAVVSNIERDTYLSKHKLLFGSHYIITLLLCTSCCCRVQHDDNGNCRTTAATSTTTKPIGAFQVSRATAKKLSRASEGTFLAPSTTSLSNLYCQSSEQRQEV